MTARPVHLVFTSLPLGPTCNPNCPGEGSEYHDGYADGFEKGEDWGEQKLASLMRTVMPAPPTPIKPDWIVGPTRSHWARVGIKHAIAVLGFRD